MDKLFNGFYKGKRVLVTGHTGFKGTWLSIWLNELGADVIGYALDPHSDKDNFVLSGISNKITDIRGDIRDIEHLSKVFDKYKPEIVLHLAAQPLVRLSYESPRETFEQNIMGTINVLECVRKYSSVRACLCITSDKCYENKEWFWGYRETDPMGGHDPYSASKGCSELVIASYIKSYFNPNYFKEHNKVVASVRAGNVIGGGDWSRDRIIPDCIKAFESDKDIELRSPKAVRPWQHVLEPLSGYLWLASVIQRNPKMFSGAWNFGPISESIITVRELVEKLIHYYGKGKWIDKSENTKLHEATLLSLDCGKAFQLLKWKPSLSIDNCIELTVEWYINYQRADVYSLCVNEISKYVKLGKSVGNLWAVERLSVKQTSDLFEALLDA